MITAKVLNLICRNISEARAVVIADALNKAGAKYKINIDMMQEFLANLAHESGEFTIKAENLNYTTPQRLVAIWPSRFSLSGGGGKRKASDFVRNPTALANVTYNGRMGNRNGTNDGFNFRGGGFAQITGRDAYTIYTAFVNARDNTRLTIEQVAQLVMTDDYWAMDSAAWFFCEFKNLEQLAMDDRFRDIVKRWNGGFIGIDDRMKYYNRCLQFLK